LRHHLKTGFIMANKNTYQQRSSGNNHNGDFDLDEYIRQQSNEATSDFSESVEDIHPNDDSSQFKNAILIFVVFATAFLWYNDWKPVQAWNAIFGSDEVPAEAPAAGNDFAYTFEIPDIPDIPEINIEIPDIEVPPLPPSEIEGAFSDYLASIRDAGLQDVYSNSGFQALYQTGVPVDYLVQLHEEGFLNEFSYSAIIGLYHGDVTLEYLQQFREAGYLENYSYSAIIGMYNGGVTTEYLNQLSEGGFLEEFSYSAIIAFYNTGVTVEYLNQLQNNGLLEDMSYSEIIMAFVTDN
jgi:hypothetical protein